MLIRRHIKRALRVLAGGVVAMVIALLTLPYWLAPVLRPVARRRDVTWTHHQREGYGTLELHGLRASADGVRITAGQVRLKLPTAWLGGLLSRADTPFVQVTDWTLELSGRERNPVARDTDPPQLADILDQAGQTWRLLSRWLPVMTLGDGTVLTHYQTGTLSVPVAEWTRAGVHATMALRAPDASILMRATVDADLRWPASGRLSASLIQEQAVRADTLPLLATLPVEALLQGELHLNGHWNRGPLHATLTHAQTVELDNGFAVHSRLQLESGRDGITFRTLEWKVNQEPVLIADGHLPVILVPGGTDGPALSWDPEAPLRLRASTVPEAPLWAMLGEGIPAWPVNPVLFIDLEGSRAEPRGRVRLQADRMDYALPDHENGELPLVSDVALDLVFTENAAVLEDLSFRVAGQAVTLTARLPLGGQAWRDLVMQRQLPHWSRVEGSLSIPGADVAAFRTWFPAIIAPTGRFTADIRFQPGGFLGGSLSLRDGATRPLMPLGILSSIDGELRFDGRTIVLDYLTGRLGERDVTVTGEASLTETLDVAYTLNVTGKGIPLVRRPGLLLRGDMDVTVTGQTGEHPRTRISGNVDLTRGYYLSELRIPTLASVTVPGRRPPFFSVDTAPFEDWELDLRIGGQAFMQVRSPVFTGLLSADFHLGGTLGEPVAPGSVEFDQGTVRFPFGTLNVARGRILLTQENPFTIALDIMSDGRVFGYDVSMFLLGTAEDPVLEFSSTPPLGSDAILLMVTAGQLPARELEFTGAQRAARLAVFLGQNLLYELTGDEHVGDRLLIESGRNISRSGRETYVIRYRLHERLSVTGEYDEYDALNAGIKWRLFSR